MQIDMGDNFLWQLQDRYESHILFTHVEQKDYRITEFNVMLQYDLIGYLHNEWKHVWEAVFCIIDDTVTVVVRDMFVEQDTQFNMSLSSFLKFRRDCLEEEIDKPLWKHEGF